MDWDWDNEHIDDDDDDVDEVCEECGLYFCDCSGREYQDELQ